jgi:hypothetical protein
VGRGLFAAAVPNEKTASKGDRLSLECKRTFSEKVLSSIASAFPISFAGLLAISIIPLMPIAFSSIALSSIAFARAVAAIVVLTVAAMLP